MYLAIIEPGTYLDFSHPVPFMLDGQIVERGVLNLEGKLSGRAQSAVRPISTVDFQRILKLGLGEDAVELPRVDVPLSYGMREEQMPFGDGADRDRIRYLGSRVLRDRVFRNVVLRAYSSRCAVTGLKLINGGGRAEVEAAHIRSVEKGGPDIVSNGVALSGTAHWMFDRGLISISDDLEILISRQLNDVEGVRSMINRSGHILAPARPMDRPGPRFLQWHRESCFKG